MLTERILGGWRRLRGTSSGPPIRARLFVGERCGLCEQARELMEPFERRGRVVVELVDIASDAGLFRAHCFSIPVLEYGEDPTNLAWPFNRADLRRVLG